MDDGVRPYAEVMTLAYAHQAIRLRELAPLDEKDYARATGAQWRRRAAG